MAKSLQETIAAIKPLDLEMMEEVKKYQNTLTKPAGSLGRLEEISIQIAGITGEKIANLEKKVVVVMAGDHGVVEEGVSAFPQEVTPQMVLNFANGGAAINVLAGQAQADVSVVDLGVAADLDIPSVIKRKIKYGTDNFTKGPAMSREEAISALEVGIAVADELTLQGYRLIGTGEMGIGNTTPSSAIVSLLCGCSVEEAVGPGTGVDDAGIKRKVKAIKKGIEVNQPNCNDPLDILMKLGGLEIAGIAGLILGAAANRIPVVIDGFISTAAALIASGLSPLSVKYMIGSHCSLEPAHLKSLEHLGLTPILDMKMRLGEGTGAVLAFHLVLAAVRIVREMATFASAGVSESSE